MAIRLDRKLRNYSMAHGYEVFHDSRIDSGVPWSNEIDVAIEGATHFIALICDPYWDSTECRRELTAAVKRYERGPQDGERRAYPRLLFVRAAAIDPRYFTFIEERQSGVLSIGESAVDNLGVLNFLGPYDLNGYGQLERLAWSDEEKLDDQLEQLAQRFIVTLAES